MPVGELNAFGMLALASVIAIVKMADTGAYTVGRLIGRRKSAPRLSPGKTWEGAMGAILFAALTSCLVFWLGFTYTRSGWKPKWRARSEGSSGPSLASTGSLRRRPRHRRNDRRSRRIARQAHCGQKDSAAGCPASAACWTCLIQFCWPGPGGMAFLGDGVGTLNSAAKAVHYALAVSPSGNSTRRNRKRLARSGLLPTRPAFAANRRRDINCISNILPLIRAKC